MSEPGDWKCNSCQEVNFKRRDSCRKCGVSKYQKITRSNDWTCECAELNFASRNACRKCGKNKPGVTQTVIPKFEMGDWYCNNTNCGEMNFKSRAMCRKCGTAKQTQVPKTEDNCIVCLSDSKTQAIKNCGHLCFCDICGFNINKCPICRVNYNPETDLLKIYKP